MHGHSLYLAAPGFDLIVSKRERKAAADCMLTHPGRQR